MDGFNVQQRPYRGNDSKIRQMCSSSTWVITQYYITFFQSVA